ncbi:ORF6N domain-containing protein [Polaribacter batillariae]|uniref:ORF6N domain-containing protein n=1 Tax=Polaribacter batillariae TaxID=2808900 RepID=A0ABX7STQ2_9FLAO|nr:ORF6N domain-containing protein [Polaribacter batillariae]QTD37629.1 ORF6N domain-containing protein [Polaribacter batillariae]
MKKEENLLVPDEIISNKIYLIQNQKVMLDRDLAELYQVETRVLKQAVKRKLNRFPEDFMFELTKSEFKNWRSQFVTSNSDKMGLRYAPMVFTEQGVAMLSSVLNSDRAIAVNIKIIRIFTKMRELLNDNLSLRLEIEEIKKKVTNQNKNIELVFSYLDELIDKKENEKERTKIGYKNDKRESK